MAEKLFGTDGMRGIANTYPLTIDFCTKLAVVLSSAVCTKHHKVAVARDTRISSNMLFCALASGFNSQGIDVIDLGVIPTPLSTTLTPKLNVDMTVMITASHNPYQDNGLKLINSKGDKFSDTQTAQIEDLLAQPYQPHYDSEKIGSLTTLACGKEEYLSLVQKLAPSEALKGFKIVIDSANGSFSGILSSIFRYLGAEIISLADSPNGYNINKDCGSQHTDELCRTVVDKHYDIGIAVDGDGDRIIICDEKGKRLDGDQIIAYLATYMQKHRLLSSDSVVSTVSSNMGLGKYLSSLGLNHHVSDVGERYVIAKMRETEANLGGEESGHMVLSDYSNTGDAAVAAVVICLGIKEDGRKVSEIFPLFQPFPTETQNVRFDNKQIIEQLMASQKLKQKITDISNILQGTGKILVRKSGTEPLIRLKIESENAETAKTLMASLSDCLNEIAEEIQNT